ncbi:MAG: hypothetical protein MUP36_03720 [Demequinaceae bacterium]|nr:hypothetical protein [Demequinaceae bacterium]
MENLEGGGEVMIPRFVLTVLRRSSEDLQWISGLLRDADDLEWVSDAEALYLTHLDHVKRLVHSIGLRIDSADAAVCFLAHSR